MFQKTITLLLVLIVVGGLAWYANNVLNSGGVTNFEDSPQNYEHTKPYLVYANFGVSREIVGIFNDKTKKLFTDTDEKEKVLKFSNISQMKVVAIMGENYESKSGSLFEIDLNTGKKTLLQKYFSLKSTLSLSADGEKIAYTKFSNIEEFYGYTLYFEEKSGSNRKKVYNSSDVIKSPVFKTSSKIDFIVTENLQSVIKEFNSVNNKVSDIIKDDNVIDSISSNGKDLLYSLRKSNNSSGQIDIIYSGNTISEKVTDFSGGIANFLALSTDGQIGYVLAQYSLEKINEETSGQLYTLNIENLERQSAGKGNQILGWQN